MTDILTTERNPLKHLLNIIRQVILIFVIALVGAIIWTAFDAWQVAQNNESNAALLVATGLPQGAQAYLEGTLVGRTNVDSGDYQLESVTQASNPTAINENADDAWCILGRFNASDSTARRISLVLTGNIWSAQSNEDIMARWRDAGCIVEPAATSSS